MKWRTHALIALWFVLTWPPAFLPVMQGSTRPDIVALFVIFVPVMVTLILAMPLLLDRWPTLRRWYGWTDVWTERERAALDRRDLRAYCRLVIEEGDVLRLTPYVFRLCATAAALAVGNELLTLGSGRTGNAFVDAVVAAITMYATGAMLLCGSVLAMSVIRRGARPN